MMEQENLNINNVEVINEDAFMKASIGLSYISEYMNKWKALVILGNDGKYYINFKGQCAVVDSKPMIDSLLIKFTNSKSVNFISPIISSVENWSLDSINDKVSIYLVSMGIDAPNVNNIVIQQLDRFLGNKEKRLLDVTPLYYVIGEYFKYSMGDHYEWINSIDTASGKELPILKSQKNNERIQIVIDLIRILGDQRFDSPIKEVVNLIFRKLE